METKETYKAKSKKKNNIITVLLVGMSLFFLIALIVGYSYLRLKERTQQIRKPSDFINQTFDVEILCKWKYRPGDGMESKKIGVMRISCYTDRKEETDDSPKKTASGREPYEGSAAVSPELYGITVLPGQKIWVEKLNQYFVVEDNMREDKREKVDIFIFKEDLKKAKEFGVQQSDVYIIRSVDHEEYDKKFVQMKLKLLGFYEGKIDGVCGKGSIKALKKFQKDKGLKPTGIIDKATWKELNR